MRPGRSNDLVAAAALAAAFGLAGFLFLRSRGHLGTSWSDGEREFGAATGAGVRHAVWDTPEGFEALGEASDPALSNDGRWLVFTSGARGLNSELYLAEIVDGAPREPRALEALNSPFDELAPAFGADALYFASDRAGGAGGLDLWRAPFSEGLFGAVEALGPGVNTAADESDPAPLAFTRALLFASNRARADFDLYTAAPDASGFFLPEPLAALNSPANEREPAFSSDPRSLYFASDRAGGAGAFDLYRALHLAGGFGAPALVLELSSARSERGPWPSAEGFALWFAAQDESGASTLQRARSRELFRVPPPAVTLAQWLTLALLLLLALLALLAKRWQALDILYKCLLVSLILHLLLMLYLRTVVPDARSYDTGTERGQSFRVRLAPPEPSAESRGLSGPVAPERQRFDAQSARAAAPEVLLEAPERVAEAAPAPESRALPPASEAPAPLLAQPMEADARYRADAPALELTARARADMPARDGFGAPVRAEQEADTNGAAEPGAPALEAGEAAAGELARGVGREVTLVRAADDAASRVLAEPREPLERASGTAPVLALEAPRPTARAAGGPSAGPRGLAQARFARAREVGASPEPAGALSALALAGALEDDGAAPALPARERSHAIAAAGPELGGHAPELRAPVLDAGTAKSGASTSFDATAGLASAGAPERSAPAAPERATWSPPSTPASARPEPRALEAAAPAARDLPPPARLAETPYQNRFGQQKLRALEEFGGTLESEHAVAAGLDYLARIQDENGAWGQRSDAHSKYLDVRIGKSALALLAFLGAGHVPGGNTQHAGVVERSVRHLLAAQDTATGHFGRSCSYGHGIATYALAECFALTQDERLRAPLEHAVEEILRHQSEHGDPRFFGGWGYYFADGHVWNGDEWPRTSVTAWQVMALESARLGGLAVPARSFAAAREFLLATWDPRAQAFRYDHDPDRLASAYPILPASTPAALFALSLLGVDATAAELAPARRFVLARAPDGYRYTGDEDFVARARGNPYFWYYASLALFRVGGAEWEHWNTALQETLLPAQDEDGSWRPLDTYGEYAGDEDEERTYSTAMCVLSLEVYYRYFTPLLKVR